MAIPPRYMHVFQIHEQRLASQKRSPVGNSKQIKKKLHHEQLEPAKTKLVELNKNLQEKNGETSAHLHVRVIALRRASEDMIEAELTAVTTVFMSRISKSE